MNYLIYKKGNAVCLSLSANEISSGGQGRIYKVVSPLELTNYCVKIYKNDHHAKVNKDKIEYMVNNKPANSNMTNIRICWPESIVYDCKGAFCGYIMPLAFEGSRDLKIIEIFSVGKTIAQKYPKFTSWHNKFELDSPIGFKNRIKMLHNWALATEIIHQSGKYVIVDLKPENVLATAEGKISIVDTDSFQIVDASNFFAGPVATPEYFAKFAKERHSQNLNQTNDCDCFALAIAFYKILIGSHPYSGFRLLPPYNTDEYSDIASRIDNDLFVFGKNKQYIELLKHNNMHERFFKLPHVLQTLFMQAFTSTQQPSATIWKQALRSIIEPNTRIKVPHTPRDIASVGNSEMKCLCILVVDVSGSMRLCESGLNQALRIFVSDLLDAKNGFKEYSKDQIELAIIQFDSSVEILRQPDLVKEGEKLPLFRVKGLKTNTAAAVKKAMEIVSERKKYYFANGISYYRPWIILLTDGNPNPCNPIELNSLFNDIQDGIQKHHFMLSAIGIGSEVDAEYLKKISCNNYYRIKQTKISEFFKTLSASMTMFEGNNPQKDLRDGLEEELKGQI